MMSIQIARTAVPIPALQRSVVEDEFWLSMDINQSLANSPDEPGEPIQPMRVHAVTAGVGKELCAEPRTLRREAELQQGAREDIANFLTRDSDHLRAIIRLLMGCNLQFG